MIATCGADEKIPLLKRLGCDRVINYKKENLNEVLRKEYPKGYDYFFFLYLSSFYISLLFLVLFALLSLLFTSFYLYISRINIVYESVGGDTFEV